MGHVACASLNKSVNNRTKEQRKEEKDTERRQRGVKNALASQMTANKLEISFSIRYGLHFGAPEFESLGLRSAIRLKLLFLYYRTHLLYRVILNYCWAFRQQFRITFYCQVVARDKCGQNLQSLVPAEVSYGAKFSIIASDFPYL
jgi:hypothetical protein